MAQMRRLHSAVVTVSDSRTAANDLSGDYLQQALEEAGHWPPQRHLVADELYRLRALAASLIADDDVELILITGGTGFAVRDISPQAVEPLLDRQIPGFGEVFRALSFQEIGAATMQSRALAGMANGKLVCCLPGSTGACRTAFEHLICPQIDSRTAPCNFASLLPAPNAPNSQSQTSG